MMNYKAIEKLLTGETEKESKVIRPEVFKDQTAYNTVMNNCQRIGGKRFCCIPLELLEIDEDYQRVYCINMEKVYSLVRKWDFNKCEPILVSPHPETATFAVIDGSHRMLAAGIREVWKSNFERQCALIDEFYTKNNAPTYMDPDWEEPTTMTVKEIEKIIGHPFTVIEEEVGEDE